MVLKFSFEYDTLSLLSVKSWSHLKKELNPLLATAKMLISRISLIWGLLIDIQFYLLISQIPCLRKCLAKRCTAEWFVYSVDFFVGLQIACLSKRLATL